MARSKQKLRDDNHCTSSEHEKLDGVVNNCVIIVHRDNASMFAKCMTVSVNNCIQVPFASGCSITMTCLDGIKQGLDHA